ncbi:TlpA family protein disulfide reductase [Anoxybacteroides amylolyticum]|uniref:Thioredoxin family protein n=1 Tax=Anoxybacteroides amylolyticum TaxID=294699 RepID=A0A160F5E0_9BACL|nr:TlpA disulfide reductase family protein [Anoxybacillus amylolyticus]ANB61065.1 thioredoxin family protein [Anoxybacillus amylolyticus]
MKKVIAIILLLGLTGYGIWQALAAGQTKEVGLAVSDTAPDFVLKTLDNKTVRLSELRGKTVILNFWATWCPPCQQEMPDLEKFYNDYKSSVEFLSVNLTSQDSREKVASFIEQYGIIFPVVLDTKGKILKLYNIQMIPTTYILDKNGVIRKKVLGPLTYKQLQEAIALLP